MYKRRTASITFLILCFTIGFGLHEHLFAQILAPDIAESRDPIDNRTPLILIHGFCGSADTWSHRGGFRHFFNASTTLKEQFKLYYFIYSTGVDKTTFSNFDLRTTGLKCKAKGESLHDALRIQDLALSLRQQIRNRPEIGSTKRIALVGHSMGGLIARSLMQEWGDYQRTNILITLATPHHGTLIANQLDGLGQQLSGLYWDNYDDASEPANDWLRCMNGLDPDNGFCAGGDLVTRQRTFPKVVALGLVRYGSELNPSYPDDGVVPVKSALFFDSSAPVRSRYLGEWVTTPKVAKLLGREVCVGHKSAHSAIHYDNCLVDQYPSIGQPMETVFSVMERELLAPNATIGVFWNVINSPGSDYYGGINEIHWTAQQSGTVKIFSSYAGRQISSAGDSVQFELWNFSDLVGFTTPKDCVSVIQDFNAWGIAAEVPSANHFTVAVSGTDCDVIATQKYGWRTSINGALEIQRVYVMGDYNNGAFILAGEMIVSGVVTTSP